MHYNIQYKKGVLNYFLFKRGTSANIKITYIRDERIILPGVLLFLIKKWSSSIQILLANKINFFYYTHKLNREQQTSTCMYIIIYNYVIW